jgi:hypothetical protein
MKWLRTEGKAAATTSRATFCCSYAVESLRTVSHIGNRERILIFMQHEVLVCTFVY